MDSSDRRGAALRVLAEEIVACRRCPRLVAWRQEVAANGRAAFAGQVYWGRPVPGFGDPAARLAVVGLAPGGPRGQPHRAGLHRGPIGGLALRRPVAGRLRQPAHQRVDRRRSRAGGRLGDGVRSLRAARQQAEPGRARRVPALSPPGAPGVGRRAGAGGARAVRLLGAGRPVRAAAPPSLRPPGRVPAPRRQDVALLVPPEPAEHLHRDADRADVRRRVRPGPGARRGQSGGARLLPTSRGPTGRC